MNHPLKISIYAMPDLFQTRNKREGDKSQRIIKFICEQEKIPETELKQKKQTPEIRFFCHLSIYIIRKRTTLSLQDIATLFDKKSHGSVINACEAMEDYLDTDPIKASIIEKYLTVGY